MKFYASQRLEIRKGEKIEKDKEQIGYYAKVKIAKNKVAPPFKTALIPVLFSQGYDRVTDLVHAALLLGAIERSGAFYTLGDQKVQGKDNLVDYLRENEEIKNDLEHKIMLEIKEMRMGKKVLAEDAKIEIEEKDDTVGDEE